MATSVPALTPLIICIGSGDRASFFSGTRGSGGLLILAMDAGFFVSYRLVLASFHT